MSHDQPPYKKNFFAKGPALYLLVAIVAAVTSVAIYAGAQFAYQRWHSPKIEATTVLDNPASAGTVPTADSSDAANQLRKTSESFRSVAKAVGPAVVNIKATKGGGKKDKVKLKRKMRPGRPVPPDQQDEMGPGDPFFDFFGPFFGQPFPQQEAPQQQSLGSGIIIDAKGIVVTNNHVVEGASEILVKLSSDKTEIKAKVLGTDPRTDLAVLKLEGKKDYPAANWGDSDKVEVGDWAVAIGSPFALDQSVTVGIISAKGRSEVGLGGDFNGELLQTDAAINPGNSGGPLCDLDGKVIGINTAIYTRSGGYMGIGFAIPSNAAKDIVAKLVTSGKVVRGWLGVMIQPLEEELGKELGVKEGVGVHEVLEGSPAEKAGIKAGDVVVQVDDKDVKSVTELQRRIGNIKPGDNVKLKVISYADKKTRTVNVKIGELPNEEKQASASGEGDKDEEPDALGLVVAPAKGGKEGVIIEGIQPGSFAEQFGLEVGDIIVRVNRQAVNNAATYKKQISNAKRIYLEVKRKGRTLFFQFSLPK